MTSASPSDPAGSAPDWATRQTDRIVGFIDQVKHTTTENVVVLIRVVVIGGLFLALASALLVLLLAASLRAVDAYLPIGGGVGDATWAAHLFLGTLICALGAGCWMSRGSDSKPVRLAAVFDAALLVVVVVIGIIRGLS